MNFEKPPQNPNEGKFSTLPSEKEESDVEKIKKEKQGGADKGEELDQKMEEANARKKMEEQKQEEERETANVKFLREHPDISELVGEYEDKLGYGFTEQKPEIIEALRNFYETKTGVDTSNDQEKRALEDTLGKKLVDEINKRFDAAA